MKTGLLFLLLFVFAAAFTSCSTLANRRDMYTPGGEKGPYTKMLHGEK